MSDNIKARSHNALKHGVFAKAPLLPGEDPQGYEQLSDAVFDEWEPDGITEQDAAMNIVSAIWQKHRYFRYRAREANNLAADVPGSWSGLTAWNHATNFDPSFYDLGDDPDMKAGRAREIRAGANIHQVNSCAIIYLSSVLRRATDIEEVRKCLDELPGFYRDYLDQLVPFENFSNFSDWVAALTFQVQEVLEPQTSAALCASERLAFRETEKSDFLAPERVMKDIAIVERIDAGIDRAIKRMIQVKGIKQVIASTKAAQLAKEIEAPRA